AIRRICGVTLAVEGYEKTADLLTRTLGFRSIGQAGQRFGFQAGQADTSIAVDVLCQPGGTRGALGAGIVHHVAWRTADDAQQAQWRQQLIDEDLNVSPVMDREYFHSI